MNGIKTSLVENIHSPIDGPYSLCQLRTTIATSQGWINNPNLDAVLEAIENGNFHKLTVSDYIPNVDNSSKTTLQLVMSSCAGEPIATSRFVVRRNSNLPFNSLFNGGGFLTLQNTSEHPRERDVINNGQPIHYSELRKRLKFFENTENKKILDGRMTLDPCSITWERLLPLGKEGAKNKIVLAMFEMTKAMEMLQPFDASYIIVESGRTVQKFIEALVGRQAIESVVQGTTVGINWNDGDPFVASSIFEVLRVDGDTMRRTCNDLLRAVNTNDYSELSPSHRVMANMLHKAQQRYGAVTGEVIKPEVLIPSSDHGRVPKNTLMVPIQAS